MKKKKLATGGKVNSYIKDPSSVLQQLNINMAQAQYQAESDPLVNVFGVLSQLSPMLMDGIMANGGTVGGTSVEVEGKEVAQIPTGDVIKFKGKSHEQGGIDVSLPEGTDVFSDRIMVEGETMAQRKVNRTKKETKLEKIASKDTLAKNALERVKVINKAQEAQDKAIQDALTKVTDTEPVEEQEFALGGEVPGDLGINAILKALGLGNSNIPDAKMTGITSPPPRTTSIYGDQPPAPAVQGSSTSTSSNKDLNPFWSRLAESLSPGDLTGITGNLIQALGPMRNTLQERGGDTPNVNSFLDYGEEGLSKMGEARGLLGQQEDNALQDLELSRNAAILRNRNSAGSVNTSRALDLATDASVNNAEGNIRSQFSNQLMSLLSQEAQMENQQDQVVMGGEAQKDLADRQDRGAFYSNKAQDITSLGEGISRVGANLNEAKTRKVSENYLNDMFGHVQTNTNTGVTTAKVLPESGFSAKTQYPTVANAKNLGGVGNLNDKTPEQLAILNYLASGLIPTPKTTRKTKKK